MTNYTISLVFDGLDLDDSDVVQAIFDAVPEAVPARINGVTTVSAELTAPNAELAALALAEKVVAAVHTAVPVRVDQDLVSISDIAERTGRTRESVRLLVDGKRGPGNFPGPVGVVGDAIRIWPWAVVTEWFRHRLGTDLGETGLPPESAAVLDACFAARRSLRVSVNVHQVWRIEAKSEAQWRMGGGLSSRLASVA